MNHQNSEIPQNWDFYMCRVEEKPASIRLNLALVDIAPLSDYPYQICLIIKMLNPDENGFSSQEEYPILCDIEDAVDREVSELNTITAGVMKSNGEISIYMYGQNEKDIAEACKIAMKNFPAYQYHIEIDEDKNWDTYLQFLYPDAYSHQAIQNRKVIYNLEQQGDNLEKAREIDHWIYFANEENTQKFITEIKELGYKILSSDKLDDDYNYPYQVHIVKEDMLNNINETTWQLLDIAEALDGIYDGWGCNIIKD